MEKTLFPNQKRGPSLFFNYINDFPFCFSTRVLNSPLLRIRSSKTVCPSGTFLQKTWAERKNMASTAEPFSRAIWSSWSSVRKPARNIVPPTLACKLLCSVWPINRKYLEYSLWTPQEPEPDLLPSLSAGGSSPLRCTDHGAGYETPKQE